MSKGGYFLDDDSAAIGLPIYLTVIVVILGVGLFILSGAVLDAIVTQELQQFREELTTVMASAEHLYAYAGEGAIAHSTIHVPSSVRLLVLGGLPGSGSQILHDRSTSTNYYFLDSPGSLYTSHVQARLCGQNVSCPAVFTKGIHQITLRLVQHEESLYVSVT